MRNAHNRRSIGSHETQFVGEAKKLPTGIDVLQRYLSSNNSFNRAFTQARGIHCIVHISTWKDFTTVYSNKRKICLDKAFFIKTHHHNLSA